MDETGFFFRMEPDTTLATQQLAGKKKIKKDYQLFFATMVMVHIK